MLEDIVKHFPCVTRPPTSHDSKGVAVAGKEGAEDSVADDDGALLPVDLFIFENCKQTSCVFFWHKCNLLRT